MKLHIDFETRSPLDLKTVGLHNYARHPDTGVWCMAWALGDEDPKLLPIAVPDHTTRSAPWVSHVRDGGIVVAHNAAFEYEIWNSIMVPRHGWPELKMEQMYCTMAQSYAMGLPGALEDAALALGLSMLKDIEGRSLMLRYARPWKQSPLTWMDKNPRFTVGGVQYTGETGLQKLYEYCQQDVRVERELDERLMPLSDKERRIFLLDHKINQRGIQVDVESAKAALKLIDNVKAEYESRITTATDGAVQTVTAIAALKEWCRENAPGHNFDGLAKQDVIDLLDDDTIPERVRNVLILRQEAGKASNAKFGVITSRLGADNRLRQMYQYHGSATGRWAGRGVQTHNLPRDMRSAEEVERILELVRKSDHNAIDMLYGPPLTELSRALRSFFVAPPGRVLVNGDWSNVEGRGQAWFAGEQWKLDAFKAADEKRGPGIYELAYSRMFNVPVESVKNPSEERQIGKVSELAFGYQGGKGSFATMGRNYNIHVEPMKAEEFKRAWRAAHPAIVNTWRAVEEAAIAAVRKPGSVFLAGAHPVKFRMVGSFLWCLLPSGRALCYPYPRILPGLYGDQLTYMTNPSPDDRRKGAVIADPRNAANFARVGTYGGALYNNIIQGFCRDFLADSMLALDEKGAMIVLHTHDDISIEVAEAGAERARRAMGEIMRTPPEWATGFPLHTKPAVMRRYGK